MRIRLRVGLEAKGREMRFRWLGPTVILAVVSGCLLCAAPAGALTFQFDYSYDTGFFTNPSVNPQAGAARAALEYAAKSFEMLTDDLAEIRSEDPCDLWDRWFYRPDTGAWTSIPGEVIPARTLVVFVGAQDMGETLGWAGPGSTSSEQYYSEDWPFTFRYRRQAGAPLAMPTDFGPWGGSISFNSATQWRFDLDDPPAASEDNDFLSTAWHEMCHLLGYGTAESWHKTYADAGKLEFHGPASVAAHGGVVPLADDAHWGAGIESTVGGELQEAALDPNLTVGTRKRLTALDLAGLEDIGWEMPLPGDADHDGDVDYLDYLAIKRHINTSGTWEDGDFDFDGDVDRDDLVLMSEYMGLSYTAAAGDGGSVPAPTALALIAAGLPVLLRRRSRARR